MDVFERLRKNGIVLTHNDLEKVVQKYNIKELAVFGSSIRSDFTADSDIDLLIEFKNSPSISLFDLLDIQEYFEGITNRPVDIVEAAGLTNPYRRDAILKTKEILYVA
jgi:predicted nucleotidyltransferase